MNPPDPLTAHEATRAAAIFLHHEQVVSAVRASVPYADLDDIHDAFLKITLKLAKEPEEYDSNRGDLVNFLVAATRSRLRDTIRSHESRQERERKKGEWIVAERRSAARQPLEVLADAELAEMARAEVARTIEERRFLELWESGVEDHAQYARVLRIEHLEHEEQEKLIKQTRDRLTTRLRRLMERWRAKGGDE